MAYYEHMLKNTMPPEDKEFFTYNLGVHDDYLDAYHAITHRYKDATEENTPLQEDPEPKVIKHFSAIISHGERNDFDRPV